MKFKGFSKYILDNHPDPDSLLDTGNIHTQMTKLANDYAEYYYQQKLKIGERILGKKHIEDYMAEKYGKDWLDRCIEALRNQSTN